MGFPTCSNQPMILWFYMSYWHSRMDPWHLWLPSSDFSLCGTQLLPKGGDFSTLDHSVSDSWFRSLKHYWDVSKLGISKPLLSFPPWNFRIMRYETEKSTQNIPPGRALLSHPSWRPYVGSPIFVGSRPARVKTGPMTGPMTGEVDSSNLAACLTSDKYRNRDKNYQKWSKM